MHCVLARKGGRGGRRPSDASLFTPLWWYCSHERGENHEVLGGNARPLLSPSLEQHSEQGRKTGLIAQKIYPTQKLLNVYYEPLWRAPVSTRLTIKLVDAANIIMPACSPISDTSSTSAGSDTNEAVKDMLSVTAVDDNEPSWVAAMKKNDTRSRPWQKHLDVKETSDFPKYSELVEFDQCGVVASGSGTLAA